jgi:hypothetical protein
MIRYISRKGERRDIPSFAAIHHLSIKIISRSKGKPAVAVAACRVSHGRENHERL